MSEIKYKAVEFGVCLKCGFVGTYNADGSHGDKGCSGRVSTSTLARRNCLPIESDERKAIPLCTGVLDYFTAALAEVAKVSKAGNDQHNPGEELHWARGKSMDNADCIARHLFERGTWDIVYDDEGQEIGRIRHSAKLAWRALALLQLELEAEGAPMSRGSK